GLALELVVGDPLVLHPAPIHEAVLVVAAEPLGGAQLGLGIGHSSFPHPSPRAYGHRQYLSNEILGGRDTRTDMSGVMRRCFAASFLEFPRVAWSRLEWPRVAASRLQSLPVGDCLPRGVGYYPA